MLRFKLEKAAIIMISLYIVSMSIKLISWSLYFSEGGKDQSEVLGWLQLFDMNAQFFMTLCFYYYIFEMRGVFLALKAQSSHENEVLQYKNLRQKVFLISGAVLLAIICTCLSYRSFVKQEYEDDPASAISICLWIVRIL